MKARAGIDGPPLTVSRAVDYGDRAAWLDGRMGGIGGSEAPVLYACGWRGTSPCALWAQKRGNAPPDDSDEAEWLRIGRKIEPVVAEMYAEDTGRTLVYPGPHVVHYSTRWPWMCVSVDRFIYDPTRGPATELKAWGVLECKNRGRYTVEDWETGAPLAVQIQVRHALAVTGLSWGSAAVLLGGNRFRWVDMEREEDFEAAHVETCREFWRRVEENDPPEIDGSEATAAALKRLYPKDDGSAVDLDGEAARWATALDLAKQTIADGEAMERLAQNRLRAAIGAASSARLPDGTTYTLKTITREAYTVEGMTYRALLKSRAKKGK